MTGKPTLAGIIALTEAQLVQWQVAEWVQQGQPQGWDALLLVSLGKVFRTDAETAAALLEATADRAFERMQATGNAHLS